MQWTITVTAYKHHNTLFTTQDFKHSHFKQGKPIKFCDTDKVSSQIRAEYSILIVQDVHCAYFPPFQPQPYLLICIHTN